MILNFWTHKIVNHESDLLARFAIETSTCLTTSARTIVSIATKIKARETAKYSGLRAV